MRMSQDAQTFLLGRGGNRTATACFCSSGEQSERSAGAIIQGGGSVVTASPYGYGGLGRTTVQLCRKRCISALCKVLLYTQDCILCTVR